MPFALVTIGLVLIVTGAKDTYQQLGHQLIGDFTGDNNFTWWVASIGAIGALGYIESLRPFSRAFLALILVGMVLRNGGVFTKLQQALTQGPLHPQPTAQDAPTAQSLTNTATSLGQTPSSDLNVHASNLPPPLITSGPQGPQLNLPLNEWFGNILSQLGLRSTPAY